MSNPNINCLAGVRCPGCGSYGPLRIQAASVFLMYDDGTDHHEDVEYGGDAPCACVTCGYRATTGDFLGQGGLSARHAVDLSQLADRLGAAVPDEDERVALLDDLVADCKDGESAAINNAGISAQLEYLYEALGPAGLGEAEIRMLGGTGHD